MAACVISIPPVPGYRLAGIGEVPLLPAECERVCEQVTK